MKKILAILLAGMMAVTALAGCGGNSTESSGSGEESGAAKIEVKDDAVDDSVFGSEDNITLKVWAPDKAKPLVEQQVKDFQALYPNKKFAKIEVVVQGEGDAVTQLLNDANAAADVFSFASDQLNKAIDAKVIAPCAFKDYVSETNVENTVTAATIDGQLYAYPETNDNGYYLVYNKSVVSDEQAKTLEGILEACKAKKKEFIFNCGDGFYGCTFAFTAGAKIDGLEPDGTQKFTEYDENTAVATLQAFSKLMHDYKDTFIPLDNAQLASGLETGTAGAGVDGSWNTKADEKAQLSFPQSRSTVRISSLSRCSVISTSALTLTQSSPHRLRSSLSTSQVRSARRTEQSSSVGVPQTRSFLMIPLLRTALFSRLSSLSQKTLVLRLTSLLHFGSLWATLVTSLLQTRLIPMMQSTSRSCSPKQSKMFVTRLN